MAGTAYNFKIFYLTNNNAQFTTFTQNSDANNHVLVKDVLAKLPAGWFSTQIPTFGLTSTTNTSQLYAYSGPFAQTDLIQSASLSTSTTNVFIAQQVSQYTFTNTGQSDTTKNTVTLQYLQTDTQPSNETAWLNAAQTALHAIDSTVSVVGSGNNYGLALPSS